jgi:hypothetical protein
MPAGHSSFFFLYFPLKSRNIFLKHREDKMMGHVTRMVSALKILVRNHEGNRKLEDQNVDGRTQRAT